MKKKAKKFTIPTSFMSGGFKIQVYYDENMVNSDKPEVGLNCLGNQQIYMQPPIKDRVSEIMVKQAFLHELVHQILSAMGEAVLVHDERFVDAFAHQLLQFIETSKGDLIESWEKDVKKGKSRA